MILTEEEFKDRSLTQKLKEAALASEVSLDQVGFGIYDPKASSWNFSDMPFGIALVFGACEGVLAAPLEIEGGSLCLSLIWPQGQQTLCAST